MYFSKAKGDSMEHSMERNENIIDKQINIWKLYKDGTEKKDSCRVSLFPMTRLYVLTLSVSDNLQEIVFCPEADSFISCHIISAIDTFKTAVSCEPIDAYSYNGIDIFQSSFPKYRVRFSGCTKGITITYTYEILSQNTSENICRLIASRKSETTLEARKEKFYQDAIHDLCQQESLNINSAKTDSTKIQYIETIKEIPQENSYYQEYNCYKERYEAVINSTCWKLTKPLRKGMDLLRRNNSKSKEETLETRDDSETLEASSIQKEAYECTPETPWIGVHMHLYYEDLLEEFCGYLNHITEPFDLYISCKEDADQKTIWEHASQIRRVQKVVIRETINRGRDIAPFYVLFRQELAQYECLLHIHTKKSLYTGQEKAEWRHWALDGVLKNEEIVANILYLMKNATPKAGLVFGEMTETLPLMALHWLRNKPKGRELSQRLDIKFEDTMFFYPVGSFFWARTDAIKPLFDLNFSYEDFDEECGQIDGTLAHALERIIACLVKQKGFRTYIFDPSTNHFSLEKSYGSFKTYFSYTKENVGNLLLNFDVISFDIFDTLITRLVYEPDDVFQMMERLIYARWGKKVNYLNSRKEAEHLAVLEHGDYCNIHHIYEQLPKVSIFTEEEAQQLKNMEIQLEYNLCIPRREALSIYKKLVLSGRRVILVSDMYLTEDIITELLKKCGYEGYESMWVSCEKGKRKDNDTLWEEFFKVYGSYKTIHIGDNPHSDCQLVGDRQRINMLWLSPRAQFRFSDQFDKFRRFIGTSIENSLMLGFLVNQCFYNSPFALHDIGFAQINTLKDAAQGIFAPLFLCFSQYLSDTCSTERVLLFLSREGYFLQKLYAKYSEAFQREACKNYYFLASRRAASVAQIREYKDAKELLKTSFEGKASTFFAERFGLKNTELKNDEMIQLPNNKQQIIETLAQMAEPILQRSDYERETYLAYIRETLGEDFGWDKATFVDVGYAGTIQYYLMKILNLPLDGRYLVTEYNIKPLALGGSCASLYSFKMSKLFENTQLFLEAVTAAPYGQLIYFEKNTNGSVSPVYKEDGESCWRSAKKLQEYIYEYVELFGSLLKDISPKFDKELAEAILSEVLRAGLFGEKLKGTFTVYDGYCMDGEWVYDEKETKWVLLGKKE